MDHRKPVLMTAALLLALGGVIAALAGGTGAQAATTSLCQEQTASVSGGTYIVQNNEFDSSASECVTTDGNADFTVANSSIANATNGVAGRLPVHLPGLPLGQLQLRRADLQPHRGLQPDDGQGDDQLVHHPARRQQQRLRRGLRHLDQPDADHLRPAQRNRDHGLAQSQRQRPAVRLRGRQQRQPRRTYVQHLVRNPVQLGHGHLRHDQRGDLGQQPGCRHAGAGLGQPRLHQEQLVPDRRRGRVRAVAGRRRAGDQLLLGQHQRQLAEPVTIAQPDDRLPRALRQVRRLPARAPARARTRWSTAGRAASRGRSWSRTPARGR